MTCRLNAPSVKYGRLAFHTRMDSPAGTLGQHRPCVRVFDGTGFHAVCSTGGGTHIDSNATSNFTYAGSDLDTHGNTHRTGWRCKFGRESHHVGRPA